MNAAVLKEKILDGIREFGFARWVIVAFLALLWILAYGVGLNIGRVFGDCLVRTGMNGILVLALVLPVRAGNGLNFGVPLGIVCGLVGGVFALELAAPHPFGIESIDSHRELAQGWSGLWIAHLVAIPLAAVAGLGYGWLLERVRGQEMMVGIYVGFGAVAGMCILWLKAPFTSPELIWPLGGEGVRYSIVLNDYFRWQLDALWAFTWETWTPQQQANFEWPKGFYIPTGLLVFWLGACALIAAFLRTRLGTAMTAAGENPTYARSIGIPVRRMRIASMVISTVMAASGILVLSQSYGFLQLYKGPLFMGFMTVAALLLGGASLRRATVTHVIIGTFLFQSLLTTSVPVVNTMVEGSRFSQLLENFPEIARLVIQNGVILYALTRVGGSER